MAIDIAKADTIYIQFSIGLILSIESIIIKVLIIHIKFYIVKASNFILLCFIDINWLSIYFYNINKFSIIKSTYILIISCFNYFLLQ